VSYVRRPVPAPSPARDLRNKHYDIRERDLRLPKRGRHSSPRSYILSSLAFLLFAAEELAMRFGTNNMVVPPLVRCHLFSREAPTISYKVSLVPGPVGVE